MYITYIMLYHHHGSVPPYLHTNISLKTSVSVRKTIASSNEDFFFKSSVKVYQSDTFCYYDIKTVIVFHHILNLQMKRMILKQKWTVLFYKMAFRTKKISLCIIFTLASLCFFLLRGTNTCFFLSFYLLQNILSIYRPCTEMCYLISCTIRFITLFKRYG